MMDFYFNNLNIFITIEALIVGALYIIIFVKRQNESAVEKTDRILNSKEVYLYEIEQFFSDSDFVPKTSFGRILTTDYQKIQDEYQDRKSS